MLDNNDQSLSLQRETGKASGAVAEDVFYILLPQHGVRECDLSWQTTQTLFLSSQDFS